MLYVWNGNKKGTQQPKTHQTNESDIQKPRQLGLS